ncbi:hypothetical protein BvCmsNSNP030_5121 (plasmid) [Escherichia coli]|nr:hypothetical protein BvCmsNSNP030_4944 [Escherichia coli]BCM50050.1 hypothetical protein BvCmsNSNP030_5121 [Escherichia coli]
MFSILFWRGEDMEATGEPLRINRKVNFAPLPGNQLIYKTCMPTILFFIVFDSIFWDGVF